jgi:tetratricopeptide (TPR) repeat protein
MSYLWIITLVFLSSSSLAFADAKSELSKTYALYKKGAYPQAIQLLSQIKGDNETQALTEYWTGLCHARMQQFDKAIPRFKLASQLGTKIEDLDYEMGQALYASQDLKSAREAFQRSLAKKYKLGASTYYAGFISQMLEEYPKALLYYKEIQNIEEDVDKVKQPALFQISEVRLVMAELTKDPTAKRERVLNVVLPSYKRVVAFNSSTPVAEQATARINEINHRYGVAQQSSVGSTKVSMDTKYDSNVVTQADEAVTQVSNTGSFTQKVAANASFKLPFDIPVSITPDIAMSYTLHLNRAAPSVYQNDNLAMTPAIRTKYDHSVLGNVASALFDFEMNYMLRDYRQEHGLPFYSRYFNFVLGERVKLFSFGSTIAKANFKLYSSYDEGQNAIDPGISLTQSISAPGNTGISVTYSMDYNRASDATNDRMTYRLSPSINMPQLFWEIDLNAALDLTVLDTRNQKATRGWEKAISPSLTATRQFGPSLFGNLNYAYTKNISADKENYAYSKHVTGLGLSYKF